jgi:hypothetical protein
MKARYLVITMKQIAVAILPDGAVAIELDLPHEETGFDPKLGLMAQMSPSEARQLAAALARKADEAEK